MYKKKSEKLRNSVQGFKKVIVVAIIAFTSLTAFAQQNKTINITESSLTVNQVLKKIEQQIGYKFFYDSSLDLNRRINLSKSTYTFREMMSLALCGTGKTYEINGNLVGIVQAAPVAVAPVVDIAPVVNVTTKNEPEKPEKVVGITIQTHAERIITGVEIDFTTAPKGNYPKVSNLNHTPAFAIKTNLLYDATATINIGAELKLGQKSTLDVPFNFNPWEFSNNRKWSHLLIQPEFRLWSCEAFSGHFFGFHGIYTYYNVGNLPHGPFSQTMRDYRFEGWGAGAGVSYGYHWILGKRWGLEATIGAGWVYLNYDKYPCQECGRIIKSETKNYFGVTKVGLTLIYTIK